MPLNVTSTDVEFATGQFSSEAVQWVLATERPWLGVDLQNAINHLQPLLQFQTSSQRWGT